MKYIEDYTDAGFDMSRGNNFIALHITADTGAILTAEVLGSANPIATLDSDGLCIVQIANVNQKLKIVATKNGMSQTRIFGLTNLTLLEE